MTISNMRAGVNLASAQEMPGIAVRSERQRAAADKVTAALPGNNRHSRASAQTIQNAAADIARVSQTFNKKLQFVVDQKSHEVTVKVIDKATDKVIKVLPPEELQRLHRKLKETIGFLFNEQV